MSAVTFIVHGVTTIAFSRAYLVFPPFFPPPRRLSPRGYAFLCVSKPRDQTEKGPIAIEKSAKLTPTPVLMLVLQQSKERGRNLVITVSKLF